MFVDIRSQNFPDTQTLKRVGWIAGCWSVGILCGIQPHQKSASENKVLNFWVQGCKLSGWWVSTFVEPLLPGCGTTACARAVRSHQDASQNQKVCKLQGFLSAGRCGGFCPRVFCDESLFGFELF